MAKLKLSVTLQADLVAQIQELESLRSQPLSHVVEAALKQFLAVLDWALEQVRSS